MSRGGDSNTVAPLGLLFFVGIVTTGLHPRHGESSTWLHAAAASRLGKIVTSGLRPLHGESSTWLLAVAALRLGSCAVCIRVAAGGLRTARLLGRCSRRFGGKARERA